MKGLISINHDGIRKEYLNIKDYQN